MENSQKSKETMSGEKKPDVTDYMLNDKCCVWPIISKSNTRNEMVYCLEVWSLAQHSITIEELLGILFGIIVVCDTPHHVCWENTKSIIWILSVNALLFWPPFRHCSSNFGSILLAHSIIFQKMSSFSYSQAD